MIYELADANRSPIDFDWADVKRVFKAPIDGTVIMFADGTRVTVNKSFEDVDAEWNAWKVSRGQS